MSAARTPQGNASKNNRKRKKIKRTIFSVLLVALLVGAVGATVAVVLCIKDLPPFDPDQLQFVEASFVYDNQDREITALHDEQNRVIISLDEIPEHVQKAFIAIEDERFKRHFGVDIIGFF
ncbi:MAG TPA: hypothetical protein GX693_02620, partial [Firmicutes bacterium]|nr:hypothetical protein [Bacillota bacterium]